MLATSADAAARCQNTGNFNSWLIDFKKEALASGISKRTLSEAEPLLSFDQKTIDRDSQQGVFNQTFMQFAYINGIACDVTTPWTDRNVVPYYKGTWANPSRVGSMEDYKRTVSFKNRRYGA